MKAKLNSILGLDFLMIASLAISSNSRAELPYLTKIPLCQVIKERCHGTLVATSKSGTYGVFLVEGGAYNKNVFGELVDMQTSTSVNYVGEGGCSDGISITDAHFETRYGVEIAIMGPSNLGLDLCGERKPNTYLLNKEETFIVYPDMKSINVESLQYSGATVSYRAYRFDGPLVAKTFDRNILKLNLGTAKLPMGALVDVFRIEFVDGKVEYFYDFDFKRLYQLPDGVFDFSQVCSKK